MPSPLHKLAADLRRARDDPSAIGRGLKRRAKRMVAHVPILAAKERIYDADFFARSDPVKNAMYDRLADALVVLRAPRTTVDVGCGTGRILARLATRGVEVTGVEGSKHAIAQSPVRNRIVRWNLERGVPRLGRFDICLCIEVAEHLPARTAAALVDGLTAMSNCVVFTAATPGQGGTHHINERPHSYWVSLFAERGFVPSSLSSSLREEIADISEPAWIKANLMAFERAGTPAEGDSGSAR